MKRKISDGKIILLSTAVSIVIAALCMVLANMWGATRVLNSKESMMLLLAVAVIGILALRRTDLMEEYAISVSAVLTVVVMFLITVAGVAIEMLTSMDLRVYAGSLIWAGLIATALSVTVANGLVGMRKSKAYRRRRR